MGITDELRKWGYGFCGDTHDVVTDIADRIDAAHQKAEDEWKAKDDQTWLKGYAECHAELMAGNEVIAESLEEAGWVKLPVDADGVPIHIGDEMVLQHEAAEKPYTVQSLTWDGEDWYFTCNEGFFNACGWEHYHAPTVEDVLREFADEMNQNLGMYSGEAIDADEWRDADAKTIAEYAAKLRLAEVEEA